MNLLNFSFTRCDTPGRERERLILFYFELLSNQYEKSLSTAGHKPCRPRARDESEGRSLHAELGRSHVFSPFVCLRFLKSKFQFKTLITNKRCIRTMNERQLFAECSVHYDHKMPLDRMSHEKKKKFFIENNKFASAGFKIASILHWYF